MFTGIIELTASVRANTDSKLTVERPSPFDDIRIGSSICVSGVCLTVSELSEGTFAFDVVPETLEKTKIGEFKPGNRVNLERALRVGDRFDGHIVQGHTEETSHVTRHTSNMLTVRISDKVLPYIVEKGSIAIDGVSLTVAKLEGNEVTVALIPYTMENTTLGVLKEGDKVNVETDVLARYICRQ